MEEFSAHTWTRGFSMEVEVSSADLALWEVKSPSVAPCAPREEFGSILTDSVTASSPRASSRAGKRKASKEVDTTAGLFDTSKRQD
jgi:hypothetical protein